MLNPHDHVLEFVDDYLHDVLSPADAARLQNHCESCPICKVALEEARKRHAALETVPASEASGQLIGAALARIEAYEQARRKRTKRLCWTALAAVAAAALVLAVVHGYYLSWSVSPYDLAVYGQEQLLAGSPGSLRVRLTDHRTGSPLAGIPVDIELRDQAADRVVQLASFVTDTWGTGQPHFRLPEWKDGSYELRVVARPTGEMEVIHSTIRLRRSWKLMLSSDKPVYQPGQTIHVRSLALRRPDLRPVAGHHVTFSISDPKGNVVFKRRGVTSSYGIAAADCPLATEIIEGSYAIECDVGDTQSRLVVEVKKYVLPKFKVALELDRTYYEPGQRLRGMVHADYFFGKPVAGGPVEIEVKTTDVAAKLLQRLTTRTNASGIAVFAFTLPHTLIGRQQDGGDARITLQATVTDSAGQKQTAAVPPVVTNSPLRVEVIPEAGSLVRGLANRIFLLATYADGRPAKARLVVSGRDKEMTTDDLGVASFELTPADDPIELTIRATDGQGTSGRRHVSLTCEDVSPDFLIRTDKAVYDGGETLRLVALGPGQEPVFVDFVKDGQTILTETLAMSKGRGESVVDLSPELFGTVQLCAYRFGLDGLPVRKTQVLYIRRPQQLHIETALDKAEYRPGTRARVSLLLTDGTGKPTPGALSLAGVDEAVFSVLRQAPGMEQRFYTLEKELLQPVYAIYPSFPRRSAAEPPAQRAEFERAVFARTARTEPGTRSGLESGDQEQGTTHSLSVSSFPVKTQALERDRHEGLRWIKVAWAALALVVLCAGYLAVWVFVRPLWIIGVVHWMGLLCLCAGSLCLCVGAFSCAAGKPKSVVVRREAQSIVSVPYQTGAAPSAHINPDPGATVRMRQFFPETLLWRPELITDDKGRATIDVSLADSITKWRFTASAVTADGRLGAAQAAIPVFQPFFIDLNLPVALTRGDEVSVPVVVYNYLDKPQTIQLTLTKARWFQGLDEAARSTTVGPHEVRSVTYRLRAMRVGDHRLQIRARSAAAEDAVQRPVEVVPDGRRVEQVFNGNLERPIDVSLPVPEQAIEGSAKAILKIYPSSFSQLVEGLDGIFQLPYGCFEQTSSTTYPNVLALDYLRRTKKSAPEVEARARQYIHLGYQRLLGFEVAGGGFDWFGNPPANRTLTAYGLMEFQDMARVHDVDPNLIERTRTWLLAQRHADGSWPAEVHGMHDDPTRAGADLARFSTAAYIAWAVFGDHSQAAPKGMTLDYLLSHRPEKINDPYVLALACNALLALEASGRDLAPYLDRLEALKRSSEDGKLFWWQQAAEGRTTFYGSGRSGGIETTALAALAFMHAGSHPEAARGALAWLVRQKDARGTWQSTQATVLALKALVTAAGRPLGDDRERRVEVTLGGRKHRVVIPKDEADVMRQIDLSAYLKAGAQRLTLKETSGTGAAYQVAFRYYVPQIGRPTNRQPLAIELTYDHSDLAVGDTVTAVATVANRMPRTAPMVILDLPVPAGFAVRAEDFATLLRSKAIAKYQANARTVVVYLRGLEPGKALKLTYRLQATMPVKVRVPAARAYEYYDPDKQGVSRPTAMVVKAPK